MYIVYYHDVYETNQNVLVINDDNDIMFNNIEDAISAIKNMVEENFSVDEYADMALDFYIVDTETKEEKRATAYFVTICKVDFT